jgi:hypothetical protein
MAKPTTEKTYRPQSTTIPALDEFDAIQPCKLDKFPEFLQYCGSRVSIQRNTEEAFGEPQLPRFPNQLNVALVIIRFLNRKHANKYRQIEPQ